MGKRLWFLLLFLSVCSFDCYADKIHMKSGEVFEGKLKEMEKTSFPLGMDECTGKDQIVLWTEEADGSFTHCLTRSDIKRVEKTFRKPEGHALLAQDGLWGEPDGGLSCQIVTTQKTFTIGEPMKFSVLMKNADDKIVWYDAGISIYDGFTIKDATGKKLQYKAKPCQTLNHEKYIDIGEIIVRRKNIDVTQLYVIPGPGLYTINYCDRKLFAKSNIITFTVEGGAPAPEDALIMALNGKLTKKQTCKLVSGSHSDPHGDEENLVASVMIRGSDWGLALLYQVKERFEGTQPLIEKSMSVPPLIWEPGLAATIFTSFFLK